MEKRGERKGTGCAKGGRSGLAGHSERGRCRREGEIDAAGGENVGEGRRHRER
jgi:hypothetical protein